MSKQAIVAADDAPLTQGELLEEMGYHIARVRQQMLRRQVADARTVPDILEIKDAHIRAVMTEGDIIKTAALKKVLDDKESRMGASGIEESDLSPQGLKLLSDVVKDQTETQSTVLGLPTKLTGNLSHHVTSRPQVTESLIHAPSVALEEAVEIEPPDLPPLEGELDDDIPDDGELDGMGDDEDEAP